MRIGIVGLPNVGKSSLFNYLTTSSTAVVESYPFTTIDANHGMAVLPDPTLERLGALLKPEKLSHALIEIIDIAGLIKDAHKGEGLGNKFLGHIREVDLIFHVIRGFKDDDAPHAFETIDPLRDRELVLSELALADLDIVERRLHYDSKRVEARNEMELLERYRDRISKGTYSLNGSYKPDEHNLLKSMGLLIPRPRMDVLNLPEENASVSLEDAYRLSVKLEEGLSEFSSREREELRKQAGLAQAGPEGLLDEALNKLGLIRFYTIKGTEVRAWTLTSGSKAIEAAEKIHSDIASGFVKAEVMSAEELLEIGSWHDASASGRLKIKGKDYTVQNGDVLLIKFR